MPVLSYPVWRQTRDARHLSVRMRDELCIFRLQCSELAYSADGGSFVNPNQQE